MALGPKYRLEQFSSAFDLRNSEGKPYLLIDGQAVNFWAERYLRDDPNLLTLQPFTSEDIDFKGNRDDVELIARQLELQPVFPHPTEMTALAGAIPFRIGSLGSNIEVVRRILGAPPHAEQAAIEIEKLNVDGNRAVMLCTTTDPYQVLIHPDPARQRELNDHARSIVRRSLELIRDHSTLNVRILTRSPLARRDFDLFKSFGNRLIFGMSLPTLRNDLAKVYEPSAPAPTQRLATLKAAAEAGIPVYVALAPTPPEVDEADLDATLSEVAKLGPLTVFAEPINIRAENVARIEKQAEALGVKLKTDVFASKEAWRRYATDQLEMVEKVAARAGLAQHLHLWPDPSLGTKASLASVPNPAGHQAWLDRWWGRISEWPGKMP